MATPPLIKTPVYQQLNRILRSLIRNSEYRPGHRFLTEREISERYDVSRVTANKALSSLVSEGLLEFRKGIGTFVTRPPMDYNLRALVSFTAEALAAGKRPVTKVIRLETLPAGDPGEPVQSALRVEPSEALLYMERLRLADDTPVILERRHLVARYCPNLKRSDLTGSIYDLWAKKYGLDLQGANQAIRAINLRAEDADLLRARRGAAGFLVISVGELAGGIPLWYERTLYRGDSYEFLNRLSGLQGPQATPGRFL